MSDFSWHSDSYDPDSERADWWKPEGSRAHDSESWKDNSGIPRSNPSDKDISDLADNLLFRKRPNYSLSSLLPENFPYHRDIAFSNLRASKHELDLAEDELCRSKRWPFYSAIFTGAVLGVGSLSDKFSDFSSSLNSLVIGAAAFTALLTTYWGLKDYFFARNYLSDVSKQLDGDQAEVDFWKSFYSSKD